jgi:hypothetical protein
MMGHVVSIESSGRANGRHPKVGDMCFMAKIFAMFNIFFDKADSVACQLRIIPADAPSLKPSPSLSL